MSNKSINIDLLIIQSINKPIITLTKENKSFLIHLI